MSKLRRGVLLLCTALCLVGGSGRESRAAKVDFLWIIDNSQSMAGEQSVLSAAADDIANQLANARCPIDWRMAVAYTDLHLPPSATDTCPGAPGPGRRRLCPFTTDLNVFRNGTPQCAYVKAGTAVTVPSAASTARASPSTGSRRAWGASRCREATVRCGPTPSSPWTS